MNGTVVDIPGITVSVVPHELPHSTDVAYTIEFMDGVGNRVKITTCFGRITEFISDILK